MLHARCQKKLEGLQITAIKINVENFEYEVFVSGKKIPKRCKRIKHCELWDNQNRINSFEFLRGLGYEIMVLQRVKLEEIQSNPSHIQNFFFIHTHAQSYAIFEVMKKLIFTFFLVAAISIVAEAQCPMCKASVESNMKNADAKGKGLNDGIIYLLATPYLAIAAIGGAWYYKRKVKV